MSSEAYMKPSMKNETGASKLILMLILMLVLAGSIYFDTSIVLLIA